MNHSSRESSASTTPTLTVSILSTPLKLVTLPKQSLPYCTHAVIKNLFFPQKRGTFFSYTENCLEVSIVADVNTIQNDFPSPADSMENASGKWVCPGLEISPESFRALQIDSGMGLDNSGKRISDLSGPLAAAGISIFYMSTYQTDFILVKEHRLDLVKSALHNCNFQNADSDEDGHTLDTLATTTLAPFSSNDPSQSPDLSQLLISTPSAYQPSSSLYPSTTDTLRSPSPGANADQDECVSEIRRLCRKVVTKHSLCMVGLNKDYVEGWGMKLIKILFYPDLIESASSPFSPPGDLESQSLVSQGSRFCSYTATDDGISLIANQILLEQFTDHELNRESIPKPLRCIQMDLSAFGLDRYGIVYSMSDPLVRKGNINLLYLSTFKTANILVNAYDLEKAMHILVAMEGKAEAKSIETVEEEDRIDV